MFYYTAYLHRYFMLYLCTIDTELYCIGAVLILSVLSLNKRLLCVLQVCTTIYKITYTYFYYKYIEPIIN